jgi:TonB-dependent starch-binding outer membrane protein SusC
MEQRKKYIKKYVGVAVLVFLVGATAQAQQAVPLKVTATVIDKGNPSSNAMADGKLRVQPFEGSKTLEGLGLGGLVHNKFSHVSVNPYVSTSPHRKAQWPHDFRSPLRMERGDGASSHGISSDACLAGRQGVRFRPRQFVMHPVSLHNLKNLEAFGPPEDTIALVEKTPKPIDLAIGQLPFDRITGSVERITGKELEDYPTVYTNEALANRLSGLNTGYGNNSPDFESFGTSLRGNGLGITYVNGVPTNLIATPQEIQEIIVAKDYGTTSLLGPNSSTGSLLATLRLGVPDTKNMRFTFRTGLRTPTFLPNMMDAASYAQAYNTALQNDGYSKLYTDEAITAYREGTSPVRYPNHDYYKELVNRTSTYKNFTGEFSGGNKNFQYFSHLGYYLTDGIESVGPGRNQSRLRINNSLFLKIGEHAKLDIGIGGSFSQRKGPSISSDVLFSTMYNYPANAMPFKIAESVFARTPDYGTNMLAELAYGSVVEDVRRDGFTRLGLTVDLDNLLKGLTFKSAVNVNIYNKVAQVLDPRVDFAQPVYGKTPSGRDTVISYLNYAKGAPDFSWARTSDAEDGDRVQRDQYFSNGFNYDRTFHKNHALAASVVLHQYTRSDNRVLNDDKFRTLGGRANYLFREKYILDVSLVNSAIPNLAEKARGQLFYSAGLAWLMHREKFIQHIPWINYLKLRVNTGIMGVGFLLINSDISSYYLTQTQYGGSGANGSFGINGNTLSTGGYARNFTGNQDVGWPKRAITNAGIDFQLAGNKVQGQFNYYKERNYDLFTLPINLYSVISSNTNYLPIVNYTDFEVNGLDARIAYHGQVGKFKYVIDINTLYRTSVTNQSNVLNYPEEYRNIIGKDGGGIYGLESDGIFQNQAEIDAHAHQFFGEVKPGDIRYKDFNGDNVVDEKDFHEIGNTSRTTSYGINLGLSYGNWSFSLHGGGVAGGQTLNDITWNRGRNNYLSTMENAWPVSNDLPRLTTYNNSNNYRVSTFWLVGTSYFNLRSAMVSYQLPAGLVNKASIRAGRVYVAGKNLLTFSGRPGVYAPDENSGYSKAPVLNALEFGVDFTF